MVVFMILSGYSDFEITTKAINSGHVYRFIQKPWQEKELLIDINNAIERYKFLKQNKENPEEIEELMALLSVYQFSEV